MQRTICPHFPRSWSERGWNLCYYLNEAKESAVGGRQRRCEPSSSRGLDDAWFISEACPTSLFILMELLMEQETCGLMITLAEMSSFFCFFLRGRGFSANTDDSLIRSSGGQFQWQEKTRSSVLQPPDLVTVVCLNTKHHYCMTAWFYHFKYVNVMLCVLIYCTVTVMNIQVY